MNRQSNKNIKTKQVQFNSIHKNSYSPKLYPSRYPQPLIILSSKLCNQYSECSQWILIAKLKALFFKHSWHFSENTNTYTQASSQDSYAMLLASWTAFLRYFCHPVARLSACLRLACNDQPTSELQHYQPTPLGSMSVETTEWERHFSAILEW